MDKERLEAILGMIALFGILLLIYMGFKIYGQ